LGSRSPPLKLPYQFDTSGVVKLIMRGFVGLLTVVLVGIIYSLLISHDQTAALQLFLCAAIIVYFGRLFLRHLVGSVGTITSDAVVVQSPQVVGIRLAGPNGRFPITQFERVRVERVTNPVGIPLETQIGPHERVCLIGKNGTPDILIARTDGHAGRVLGKELALALTLPYQEQIHPY
jgi:hypothetical protein